jgi:FMN phosphatase YigB (HAD superfamily)
MIKLPDVNTIYFDCDDTLVLHRDMVSSEVLEAKGIPIPIHNFGFWVVPHLPHIEMLKDCKSKGQVVVVWSQGGSDWAEAVVDALGLRDHVDLCVCKPHWFVDDLMTFMFMPESCRIYKKYDGS